MPQGKRNEAPSVSWSMSKEFYEKIVVPLIQSCLVASSRMDVEEWYKQIGSLYRVVCMVFSEEERAGIDRILDRIHNEVYNPHTHASNTRVQKRKSSTRKTAIYKDLDLVQRRIHTLMHEHKMFFYGRDDVVEPMAEWR
tara:strand:+ start:482 stop:898 length:417 start_codon:yes stop_codon:yes gene_type:complete